MKPKDYTESAVNLCNPPQVEKLLDKLGTEEATLSQLEAELNESNGELVSKIAGQTAEITGLQLAIREAVEKHGSYQDLEKERYGIKYKRVSKVFHVEPFKEHYEKYVSAVVVETISVKALEGIIKGKLIEEADLKMHKVITEDVGYAFYVR